MKPEKLFTGEFGEGDTIYIGVEALGESFGYAELKNWFVEKFGDHCIGVDAEVLGEKIWDALEEKFPDGRDCFIELKSPIAKSHGIKIGVCWSGRTGPDPEVKAEIEPDKS